MDERSVLALQVQSLERDLKLADQSLKSDAIDPALAARVRAIFAQMINKREQEIRALSDSLSAGEDLGVCWRRFAKLSEETGEIFQRCLAYLEGALIRSAKLDGGICEIADALLYHLSEQVGVAWSRFTIMAEGELYGRMTEIIRLRYPHFSVWNLPIAAHEFGHYVGPEIQDRDRGSRPFDARLRRVLSKEGAREYHHLHERFADFFALYVVGPAWAYTSLILRFSPQAAEADDWHPSDRERAHFILAAMEALDKAAGVAGPFASVLLDLRTTWSESVRAVGGDPRPANAQQLEASADEMLELCTTLLPRDARYADFPLAGELAPHLSRDDYEPDAGEYALPDVLNTAWLARMEQPNSRRHLKIVSRNALELCRAVIARDDAALAH